MIPILPRRSGALPRRRPMQSHPRRVPVLMLALATTAAPLVAQRPATSPRRISLDAGWRIQSSAKVRAGGAAISRPAFRTTGWYAATMPSTVLAALVADGVYRRPYFGMNLRRIPGTTYPIGANFTHLEMPAGSPFAVSWWYRRVFRVPAAGDRLVLHFNGINYRANIWLNGRRIADSAQVAGTFRRYALDITRLVRRGAANVLAVQVFPPGPHDLTVTWVDWNPAPPDKDMGLWHEVYLTSSGDVALRHPFVRSRVAASRDSAALTVMAELRNLSDHVVLGRLEGRIGGIRFSQGVGLAPHDSLMVRFSPQRFPQLRIAHPRLWWPATMGTPALYHLELRFVTTRGVTSDRLSVPFGIREITSELTPSGARLFRINGRRILVRGGGWAPDMMLRPEPERQLEQLRYVRDLGLNTIRLEGKLENDRFWARTDSLGILVMAGWCCCSGWEEWATWTLDMYRIAAESERDQILRLRNHPSALVWLNGSDHHPTPDVERMYVAILKRYDWPNPYLSSATARPSEVTGPSGVKMNGPYDWVPPSYWLDDSIHGGAFGYATEIGPGAAPPPIESMRRMVPAADLSPSDSVWRFHSAGGQFRDSRRFDQALAARYGAPTSVADYTRKAQLMTYEGERAMFEAYTRNAYRSTGVIQWMLNDAWPSTFWHLYDYYLRPGGGYFGTKKALEPVHVMYAYDDGSVVVVNRTDRAIEGLRVRARVLDLNASVRLRRDTVIDLPADTALRVLRIPRLTGLSTTYFVDLRLERGGRAFSTNVYWLSTHPDLLETDSSTWYVTPVRRYADFTALRSLPPARIAATVRFRGAGGRERATVRLKNTGRAIAFFLRLRLTRGPAGAEVLPVLWQDNYVTLLPGETRTITASVRARDLRGARPAVHVDGWNLKPTPARPDAGPP